MRGELPDRRGGGPMRHVAPGGGYDAGVQPPPPGFPPQWGSPPNDPGEHNDHGQGGQPAPGSQGQQPPYPAYSPPPAAAGYPQAGYGQHAAWPDSGAPTPRPTTQQTVGCITFAVAGLLGLLGAILTLTLWINLNSAVNRATDVCSRFGGEYSTLCRQQIKNVVPSVPAALAACLFLITAAGLAASAGAVMLLLKRQTGQFLILGGGIVMLMLSIGCEARYGPTGRVTYDLIAGFVLAAVGGLLLIPAFRLTLGLPPKLTSGPGPGMVQSGGQWPYGQPPPPQQGPPSGGGYPPQQW